MTFEHRAFTCLRDGLHIACVETIAAEQRRAGMPAIIISHGFGGNMQGTNEAYCEAFAAAGYAAFRFDFCGGGVVSESDGLTTDMTIWTEAADLTAVVRYVQALPYVDASRIVLMGESQGGFVSGLVAAALGKEIWRLIMAFPALCIPDHARLGCLGGALYSLDAVPEVMDCPNGMRIGRVQHEAVVGMDPFLELAKYDGPVLLMHGMQDAVVNWAYSVKARAAYRPGQCHLQLIRSADHGFNEEIFEAAVVSALQFLEGKREVLTIQVIVTHACTLEKTDAYVKYGVYFGGWCDTETLRGTILPGAVDVQTKVGDEPARLRAEYTLEGLDPAGKLCRVHVVNQKRGRFYRPVIDTDSEALGWMNGHEFVAALEGFDGGLTVRIFG